MFQQYQNGVTPVTGVSEAGANIGKMYQQGLMSIGASIGEGLKKYGENQQQDEFLTAKGAGIAENLKFMQKNINDIPELAQFAERFNPLVKKFGNFAGMSRNQKAGFIAEAEAFQAQIAPNLAIYKEGLVSRTQQGVQSALSQKVSIPTEEGGKPLEAIPFLPAKTTAENFALNKKAFEVQAEAQGLSKFSVDNALNKLASVWEHNFANDPNLSKTDPKFRDTILKGLSEWRNMNKVAGQIESQTSEEYGIGENAMAQVAALSEAQKGANVAPATAMREQKAAEALAEQRKAGIEPKAPVAPAKPLTAQEKFDTEASRLERETYDATIRSNEMITAGLKNPKETKEYEQLRSVIEKNQSKLDSLKVSDFKNDDPTVDILKTKAGVDTQLKTLESELADLLKEQKADTSYFTKRQSSAETSAQKIQNLFKSFIADTAMKQSDPSTPIVQGIAKSGILGSYSGLLSLAGEAGAFDTRTQAQKDLAKVRIGVALDKKLPAPLNERIQSLKDNIATLKGVSTEAQKAVKAVESANEPEKPADTYDQPFDYKTKIQEGVIAGTREETYAEEKERVRQWFVENNKGIIPSSLDAVYKSIRPETDVKFMPAPDGGQVMITSKGAQYIPPVERKPMTDEQRSDVSLFNYGTPDASGTRIIPEERAKGSGIKLAGFVKGGKESAKEFKKLHDDTVQTRIIIPKLLAMYEKDKLGRTMIPSEMWGEAESLLAKLKAAIRVETVGTGPVALPEHQMILERIGDPRKFFQFDTVGKSKLNSIMNSMQDSLKNNSAGIQVTFAPTAGDVKGIEQQARIEANR